MDWGKSIKLLRNEMLLTQKELSEKIGVSFASINRYENGIHEPTMKVKRKLKKLFIQYHILEGEMTNETK